MNYLDIPVLQNDIVRLEPLTAAHHDDLVEAVSVGDLWRAWYTLIPSPDGMADAIAHRLALHAEGKMVPWAIVDLASHRAIGMTTYMNIEPLSHRLEIGSTWIGQEYHGTRINPAAKLLLLTRAFDDLGCGAVEFRTHWHNRQSRAAIAKLGAKQDGILRNHVIFDNGIARDTVVFSIIDREWPTVRHALTERLRG